MPSYDPHPATRPPRPRPRTADPATRAHGKPNPAAKKGTSFSSVHHDEDDCDCGPGPAAYMPDLRYVKQRPPYTKFPTDDRWRERETALGPGPVYHPNYAPVQPSPRGMRFLPRPESQPRPAGPGFYDPHTPRCGAKNYVFGKEDRSKYMGAGVTTQNPGPIYNPKEIKCCMGPGPRMGPPAKQRKNWSDPNPGPGAYNPKSICCGKHKPGPKFGTSPRFENPRTHTPGPMYHPSYKAIRPQSAGPTMGVGKRFPKHCPC